MGGEMPFEEVPPRAPPPPPPPRSARAHPASRVAPLPRSLASALPATRRHPDACRVRWQALAARLAIISPSRAQIEVRTHAPARGARRAVLSAGCLRWLPLALGSLA